MYVFLAVCWIVVAVALYQLIKIAESVRRIVNGKR
jgi:hypothetical protein